MKRFLSFLVILIMANTSMLFAQDDADQADKTLSPYFIVLSDDPSVDMLPLKSTSAQVNIVGVIADVTITQVYKNEGKNTLEAIYTFPASTNAAVYSMEMTIGKRIIVAEIREKKKAREEYEKAKEEGHRTSLLEQSRPNVFQMNVANIASGDEIKVVMKYTELLIPEGGTYKFVYPTVVGPRYSNKSGDNVAQENKFVESPYQKKGEEPFINFNISAHVSAGMPIQNIVCNTHKVNISYPNTSSAEVLLDKSETKAGNRDFIIEYKLSGGAIESGLLLYPGKDENFFLMMMQPPKTLKPEDIPPREYIFIVDVSGSMIGYPVGISKKLLRNLVVNLRPTDKFNMLFFAGSSEWLSDVSLDANEANIDKAMNLLDQQKGGGGTEMLPAFKRALALPRGSESLSRSFVIITDGYVDVEKEMFDLIRNNCDNANVFAFGIGEGVNRYIIEGIAHVGRGEPCIVTKPENADAEAEKFRKYISNPCLTQVKVSFGKFDVYDVEPITIPDVLAERPVIIFGKYRGQPQGAITIKGYSGSKKYSSSFDVSTVKADDKNAALRYLWARERIKLLDDYNQLGTDDARVKEVTDLGLKYNLLTAYTSFIAVDKQEVVDKNGQRTTVQQALPLPEGVENSAVGFDLEISGEGKGGGAGAGPGQPPFDEYDSVVLVFYKEVVIRSTMAEATKMTIGANIEQKINTELAKCLMTSNDKMDSVLVKVGADGKVKDIKINGTLVGKEMEKCLRSYILLWDFNQFGLKDEWTFVIKF
jgi:Ca-activated chloride channel homolog